MKNKSGDFDAADSFITSNHFNIESVSMLSMILFFISILFFLFVKKENIRESSNFWYEEWRGMKDKLEYTVYFNNLSNLLYELPISIRGIRNNFDGDKYIPTKINFTTTEIASFSKRGFTDEKKYLKYDCFIFKNADNYSQEIELTRVKLNKSPKKVKLFLSIRAGLDQSFLGVEIIWRTRNFPLISYIEQFECFVPVALLFIYDLYVLCFQKKLEVFSQVIILVMGMFAIFASIPIYMRLFHAVCSEGMKTMQLISVQILSMIVKYFVFTQIQLDVDRKENATLSNYVMLIYFTIFAISDLFAIFSYEQIEITNLELMNNVMRVSYYMLSAFIIIKALFMAKEKTKRLIFSVMMQVVLCFVSYKKQGIEDLVKVFDDKYYYTITYGFFHVIIVSFVLITFIVNKSKASHAELKSIAKKQQEESDAILKDINFEKAQSDSIEEEEEEERDNEENKNPEEELAEVLTV